MAWQGRISLLNGGYIALGFVPLLLLKASLEGFLVTIGIALFSIITEWFERMSKEDATTRKRFVILLVSNVLSGLV